MLVSKIACFYRVLFLPWDKKKAATFLFKNSEIFSHICKFISHNLYFFLVILNRELQDNSDLQYINAEL